MNTALGHEGVDNAVLPAVGDMFKQAAEKEGVQVYHRSGDEFLFRGNDPEAISRVVKTVNGQLANTEFEYQKPDGTISKAKGTGLSHGTGSDEASAEAASAADKESRKQQGLRTGTRDLPAVDQPGATRKPAPVRDDTGR